MINLQSETKPNVGIIILAAGASTRMGSPKQLLFYQGESLINHTIKNAIASICDPVILVLGANAEHIIAKINQPQITIVKNPDWHLGMSSSIRCGIITLLNHTPTIEAVVITVCDQPFLTAEIINSLVESYSYTGKPIIACEYADTLGVPVLFSQNFFTELVNLSADVGARKIIKTHRKDVFTISFPAGAIDIDTPTDYQQLQRNY